MLNFSLHKSIFSVIFVFFMLIGGQLNAQVSESKDAIAIRVIPNPDYLSANLWYQQQGWQGSPQSIIVDGYRAIRDGRTVYVNVANIVGTDLYTNIYLISYNQEAEQPTTDIFAQIIKNWKFNSNMNAAGVCANDANRNCFIDTDCSMEDYCLSDKAEIIRDVYRLEDIAEMKMALDRYEDEKGYYPIVAAGSYLQHKTLSTWPSWEKVLSQELKENLPKDPVNELGDCGDPRFLDETCWDERTQEFADWDITDPNLNLPPDSRTYIYIVSPDGMSYELTAAMESGFVQNLINNSFNESDDSDIINVAPEILGISQGVTCTNKEFEAFVEVYDPKGGLLTWSINTSMSAWNLWSAPPILRDTIITNQKSIWAANSGFLGTYNLSVTVTDEYGQSDSENLTIVLADCDPPIFERLTDVAAGNVLKYDRQAGMISPVQIVTVIDTPFEVLLEASEMNAQYPLNITIPSGMLPNGLELVPVNDTSSRIVVSPPFNGVNDFTDSLGYEVEVNIIDFYGGVSEPYIFRIVVENNPPVFSPINVASLTAVGCIDYSADVDAIDPDGHDFSYYDVSLMGSLSVTDSNEGYITGQPITTDSQDALSHGVFNITVEARDVFSMLTNLPYSASANYTYSLTVQKEVFNVSAPSPAPSIIYVYPDHPTINNTADLYHRVLTYVGSVTSDSPNTMNWSFSTTPSMPNDWTSDITNSGVINITAYGVGNNTGGTYSFQASGINPCAVTRTGPSVSLTVLPNEWCGDSNIQAGYGEECDDGDLDENDLCTSECLDNVCGDGIQLTNECGASCEECDDGDNDEYDLCDTEGSNAQGNGACTLTFCGDGLLQSPNGARTEGSSGNGDEECDDAGVSLVCASDCTLTYCGDGIIQPTNGQGQFENCESTADCSTGYYCEDCWCNCDPCIFDDPFSTFDNCCFS